METETVEELYAHLDAREVAAFQERHIDSPHQDVHMSHIWVDPRRTIVCQHLNSIFERALRMSSRTFRC